MGKRVGTEKLDRGKFEEKGTDRKRFRRKKEKMGKGKDEGAQL
jgi:hypothetical protein